ncbi:hypothetical protein RRG08_030863 [Elysia crispata]|uniref:Uncharacterized protein n=1 Tax=Elysia crispata TaxID=231223 RepID=A0AAE0XSV8_9GAST|nr:hypothetical protein RRG08_030863 [Elysia crispata]
MVGVGNGALMKQGMGVGAGKGLTGNIMEREEGELVWVESRGVLGESDKNHRLPVAFSVIVCSDNSVMDC